MTPADRSAEGAAAGARYDHELGRDYTRVREPDPRLAAAIWRALGDARSVVNVGAGAGAYEPPDCDVIAVEPSAVMIEQRPPGRARVVQATAESLPLDDDEVEAGMGVLTMQHWGDVGRGLAELLRVTSRRVVLVTMDVDVIADLWIVRDYVPEMVATHAARYPTIAELRELLPGVSVEPLPVPRDCSDGFMAAFWARPAAYLDPQIRAGTSSWADVPPAVVDRAVERLSADLASGEWERRYGELSELPAFDVGLRLLRFEHR